MMIENGDKVSWVPLSGKWIDIGRPWDLLDANEFFLDSITNYLSKDSKISSDSKIEKPSYIDAGTIIETGIIESPCLISRNVHINTKSRVHASVLRKNRQKLNYRKFRYNGRCENR